MTVNYHHECRFCTYFSRNSDDPVDAPWLSSSLYCAMVSKGAMVPGWTLLLSTSGIYVT